MIFETHLGMQTKRIDGGAEVRLDIKEQTLNRGGIVHGGVICSLVDQAIGAAVGYAIGKGGRAVTVELKVNFLAPSTSGTLIAKGRLIREGKHLIVGEAEVLDQDGRMIAKGLGTWAIIQ
ncbi:MAG: PaaI family thioesterase [Candidatus Methylomirabilis sp.]